MQRNQFKKILSLVLVLVMIASLFVTVYAAEDVIDPYYTHFSLQSGITELVKRFFSPENLLLKEIVRGQFKAAAAAGAMLGCTTAARMLNHSLQDEPEDLEFAADTRYAKQIRNSAEFVSNKETFAPKGRIAFNADPDLYLAYHGMNYEKSGDTVIFTDLYDFAYMKWEATLSVKSIVAAINNYAVFAQYIGAIQNYNISVTVDLPKT